MNKKELFKRYKNFIVNQYSGCKNRKKVNLWIGKSLKEFYKLNIDEMNSIIIQLERSKKYEKKVL